MLVLLSTHSLVNCAVSVGKSRGSWKCPHEALGCQLTDNSHGRILIDESPPVKSERSTVVQGPPRYMLGVNSVMLTQHAKLTSAKSTLRQRFSLT